MNLNQILVNFTKISQNLIEKTIVILTILALVWQFAFPRLTSLAAFTPDEIVDQTIKGLVEELGKPRVITVPVTAYNSEVGQTDSTPCITANGFNLCRNNQQNVIAANFLPFGTKVRFPDYDPNTIYTVQDRMNARYAYRADIWMKSKGEAINFGLRNLKMEIYE
ncbi:3D domain-containing protein [Candidatus Falkowbacteria bacterium]|nr:3D domain-containing protein [Candidatus Falkowbacteria bacterium]